MGAVLPRMDSDNGLRTDDLRLHPWHHPDVDFERNRNRDIVLLLDDPSRPEVDAKSSGLRAGIAILAPQPLPVGPEWVSAVALRRGCRAETVEAWTVL